MRYNVGDEILFNDDAYTGETNGNRIGVFRRTRRTYGGGIVHMVTLPTDRFEYVVNPHEVLGGPVTAEDSWVAEPTRVDAGPRRL